MSLITKDDAMRAISLITPTILDLMNNATFNRDLVHIVIVNPVIKNEPHLWEKAILHEQTIGQVDRKNWDFPFDQYARGKAKLSWRTQKDTRVVIDQFPHLLIAEDITYPGGIYDSGYVVGTSGVQSYYDEMIGRWIIAYLKATATVRLAQLKLDKTFVYMPEEGIQDE